MKQKPDKVKNINKKDSYKTGPTSQGQIINIIIYLYSI